jgi:hypothetical protein
MGIAFDIVGIGLIDFDHNTYDVGSVLRDPHIEDPSTRDPIVRWGGFGESSAFDIEHDPVGITERKVLDIDRGVDIHEHSGVILVWDHAERLY